MRREGFLTRLCKGCLRRARLVSFPRTWRVEHPLRARTRTAAVGVTAVPCSSVREQIRAISTRRNGPQTHPHGSREKQPPRSLNGSCSSCSAVFCPSSGVRS